MTTKRIGIAVAVLAGVLVVFAGARTFACGNHCKNASAQSVTTANSTSGCPYSCKSGAGMAGHVCPYSGQSATSSQVALDTKTGSGCSGSAGASMTCSGHSCGGKCQMSGSMSHAGCGMGSAAKAYHAANVYQVRDGHEWAVCEGKKFEVTSETPYTDVGKARYYFADANCQIKCAEKMAAMAPVIDREVVSLATAEANVVTENNGQKYAICPVTHTKFLVTAESPVKVADGQKYYVSNEKSAQDFDEMADLHPAN